MLRLCHPLKRELTCLFSTTSKSNSLADFFDTQKGWTWKPENYPTGRCWLPSELRIKSFDDMHKLWWVSIKQQNLLLSQKDEAKRSKLLFPQSDRLRELKKTMKNIKLVLWERKLEWEKANDILNLEKLRITSNPDTNPTPDGSPIVLKGRRSLTTEEIKVKMATDFTPKRLSHEAVAGALEMKWDAYLNCKDEKLKSDLLMTKGPVGRSRRRKSIASLKPLKKSSTWYTM